MLGFKQFCNAATTIAGIELDAPHPQRAIRAAASRYPWRSCVRYLEQSARGLKATRRIPSPHILVLRICTRTGELIF
jgi:hypothetical protein